MPTQNAHFTNAQPHALLSTAMRRMHVRGPIPLSSFVLLLLLVLPAGGATGRRGFPGAAAAGETQASAPENANSLTASAGGPALDDKLPRSSTGAAGEKEDPGVGGAAPAPRRSVTERRSASTDSSASAGLAPVLGASTAGDAVAGAGGKSAGNRDGFGEPARKMAAAEAALARTKRELLRQQKVQRKKEMDAVLKALTAAGAKDDGSAKAKGAADAKEPVVFSGEINFFRAKKIINQCGFYQGPIKKGGVTHHWYEAMYRFRCDATAERGKKVQLIWGKPDDIRVMFGNTMESPFLGAFPHLSLVSYMYAGVAELDLRVAPEVIAENFGELEELRLSIFSDAEHEGPCHTPARPHVLFRPATFQCRRPMVPLLAPGFAGLVASPLNYYMPVYKLTSSLVRVVKLLSLAALASGGRDELAVPTDCSTPLGTKHPECLCFPVTVKQHWEKNLRSPLHAQLVPFTGKQERPFLRFYARAGGAVVLDDGIERGTGNLHKYRRRVAPVGWGGADPLARGAKGKHKLGGGGGYAGDKDGGGGGDKKGSGGKKSHKAEQPCVIDGVTYESEHVMTAFLVAAWGEWLQCEPDAREWRLLAATGRGDAATAHEVIEQMVAARDNAPALVRPRDGKTALHLAAQNGMDGVVAALFRDFLVPTYGRRIGLGPSRIKPLNPTLADTATGATPLHAAIFAGFAGVALKILKEADAVRDAAAPVLDVNARDFDGNSPLHFAAARACDVSGGGGGGVRLGAGGRPMPCDGQDGSMLAVVYMLVALGAEVDCRNAAGQTPSDLASAAFSLDAQAFLGHFLEAERVGAAPTDARSADDIVKTALAAVRSAERQLPAYVGVKIEARLRKDFERNAKTEAQVKTQVDAVRSSVRSSVASALKDKLGKLGHS